jgi:sigma-B regulation protein RsbU (phosphoserine phosphatase)
MTRDPVQPPYATAAEAMQRLEQVNRELDRRLQELNTLFDIGKALNERFEREPILDVLLLTLLGQLAISRAAVFLVEAGALRFAAARGVSELAGLELGPEVLEEIPGVVRADPSGSELARWLEAQRFVAAVPMRIRGQLQGLFCLGRRIGGLRLGPEHDEFLLTLGNLAAIALDHARLFAERLAARRIEDELRLARSIQAGLLPRALPEVSGLQIAACSESSREVGGDYYDVLSLPDGDLRIAVGDVSGKGVPAALLMANVQAGFRVLSGEPDETKLVERINQVTHENTELPRFITFVTVRLRLRASRLTYVNAGHNPPYLVRHDGRVEELSEGGLILGVFPHSKYSAAELGFGAGDLLVLYTDGVTEAMNSRREQFGEERLIALLSDCRGASAAEVLGHVRAEVDRFAAGEPRHDDLTLLVVRQT